MAKLTTTKPNQPPKRRKYREGVRVPVSLKITRDMKMLVDGAAERAGRSQSAQVEIMLERAETKDGLLPDTLYLRLGAMGSDYALAVVAALDIGRQIACHMTLVEGRVWSPDEWLNEPRCLMALNDATARILARFNQPPQLNESNMIVPGRGEWHRLGEAIASWVPVVLAREKAWRIRNHADAIEATKQTLRNEFNRPLPKGMMTKKRKGKS